MSVEKSCSLPLHSNASLPPIDRGGSGGDSVRGRGSVRPPLDFHRAGRQAGRQAGSHFSFPSVSDGPSTYDKALLSSSMGGGYLASSKV